MLTNKKCSIERGIFYSIKVHHGDDNKKNPAKIKISCRVFQYFDTVAGLFNDCYPTIYIRLIAVLNATQLVVQFFAYRAWLPIL